MAVGEERKRGRGEESSGAQRLRSSE